MPASMSAAKRYQPHMTVTKVRAPPAVSSVDANAALPWARWKKAAEIQPNAGGNGARIPTKTMFVRSEQIKYTCFDEYMAK